MEFLKIAMWQLGTKEIKGSKDNPQIVEYASYTGITDIKNDDIPWCSTFVNWCAKKAGLKYSGKANARSWLRVGKTVRNPEPGDVVVFWRGDKNSWKGHVAIFLGFNSDATRVFCLGGNQGDAVSIADYDAKKVLGYRRLQEMQSLKIPNPPLKKGDKGIEVTKLQIILNHLNFNCGDVDGKFGTKTKDALKLVQANSMLKVDGEYDNESRDLIEALLQS
jgi:uncharacterized protein (TIGR02594 family)